MIIDLLAATLMTCAVSDTTVTLGGVTVTGSQRQQYQMRSSQSSVQVSRDYLQQHFSGSLMQTLEGIPGVKAMAIGSGQSKPTIRGLGFNRLAVSEADIVAQGRTASIVINIYDVTGSTVKVAYPVTASKYIGVLNIEGFHVHVPIDGKNVAEGDLLKLTVNDANGRFTTAQKSITEEEDEDEGHDHE